MFEHSDLLPRREDFQRSIHATAEERTDCSEECSDEVEHESTLVPPHRARWRFPAQAADLNNRGAYDYLQWSAWPTAFRMTVGSAEEMKKFQAAYTNVLG
jgi:hypothetical protein